MNPSVIESKFSSMMAWDVPGPSMGSLTFLVFSFTKIHSITRVKLWIFKRLSSSKANGSFELDLEAV
jgi:hypothetical protein